MSETQTSNNKRIAKNTILLYCRMLFLMGVSLYTSRVILNALGFSDYGIYNVVGGIVVMFTMVSGSLKAAISRFITFELGTGDIEKLKKVFSCSITIQIVLSVILIFLAETVGLWFLNSKMVIPPERLTAANWVYQFSIVTFVINLISLPYISDIVAHEKMSAFAYISILEAVFKLIIAWTISIAPFDRLIYYAFMLVAVAILIRVIYMWYCKKNFEECSYTFVYDKKILKDMFGFSGWNMIGATSAVCRDHGGNIILNLFFGPEINAARGIGLHVSNAIQGFVTNFQMALNPQIIKNYATHDFGYMNSIVFKGAKFSYFILFVIALPVFVSTDYILTLWLGTYPDHTIWFMQLIIIFTLIESLSGPLITVMYATGDVKNYQIFVGGLQLLNLPFSYVLLKVGFSPEIVIIVAIVLSFMCLLARLYMLRHIVSCYRFLIDVVFNTFVVSLLSATIVYGLSVLMPDGFCGFVLKTLLSVVVSSIIVLYIGLTMSERDTIITNVLSKLHLKKYD